MCIRDRTNTVRANGASQVTVNDNLVVTGNVTINGSLINYKPFWIAGMVHLNANVVVTRGQVTFTCTREAAGNYRVTFATTHPNGANYIIELTDTAPASNYWVDSVTSSSFLAVMRNSSFAAINAAFHITILA